MKESQRLSNPSGSTDLKTRGRAAGIDIGSDVTVTRGDEFTARAFVEVTFAQNSVLREIHGLSGGPGLCGLKVLSSVEMFSSAAFSPLTATFKT
jgi:hypothetical protein